jgi:hypothetical protein
MNLYSINIILVDETVRCRKVAGVEEDPSLRFDKVGECPLYNQQIKKSNK